MNAKLLRETHLEPTLRHMPATQRKTRRESRREKLERDHADRQLALLGLRFH